MTDQETTETEIERSEPAAPPPAPASTEVHYAPPPPAHAAPQRQIRTPFLAALFSLFPGLGNVYNSLYLRGITFFLIIVGLITLASGTEPPEAVLLVFAIIFVWLFNIFDAYRQATLINYGYAPEMNVPKPRFSTWGSGGLTAGIAVFLLGLYGFLREHFDIDLTLLVDYWYLMFMIFGGCLIAWTVMQKKREEEEAADDGLDLEDA